MLLVMAMTIEACVCVVLWCVLCCVVLYCVCVCARARACVHSCVRACVRAALKTNFLPSSVRACVWVGSVYEPNAACFHVLFFILPPPPPPGKGGTLVVVTLSTEPTSAGNAAQATIYLNRQPSHHRNRYPNSPPFIIGTPRQIWPWLRSTPFSALHYKTLVRPPSLSPSLPTETLKWLSSLPILMQESFWWWQCSDRYVISLSPHLHTPFPPCSPSLISRTVSVDVKHHVYLLRPSSVQLRPAVECLLFAVAKNETRGSPTWNL